MKKFLIILLFLPMVVTAQESREITVGLGPSFFGWGDVTATALTTTFSYPLNKHFSLEPRLIISSGWKKDDLEYNSGEHYTYGYNYSQTGYMAAAGSIVYTPFIGKGKFLKLKSGFLLGTMAHTYGGKRFGAYPLEYSEFGKEINTGLIHTVHFRILDREKYSLGTELSMLTSFSEGYYNCDGFVWNFMCGIKL